MAVNPGEEPAAELYMSIATVAAVYGDPSGTYAAFLKNASADYPSEPFYLWTQPLSDGGWVAANLNSSDGGGSGSGSNTTTTTTNKGGAVGSASYGLGGLLVTLLSVTAALVIV